ncbi:MAG: Hpt domain-containing protein [Pseudomonadota bacterium]
MIDWERVAELQEEIGEEDFAEIGQVFVEEIQEKLAEITSAPDQNPADFHFLRGSAANLGLTDFAQACKEAELSCKSGATADTAALVALFEEALAELDGMFETA